MTFAGYASVVYDPNQMTVDGERSRMGKAVGAIRKGQKLHYVRQRGEIIGYVRGEALGGKETWEHPVKLQHPYDIDGTPLPLASSHEAAKYVIAAANNRKIRFRQRRQEIVRSQTRAPTGIWEARSDDDDHFYGVWARGSGGRGLPASRSMQRAMARSYSRKAAEQAKHPALRPQPWVNPPPPQGKPRSKHVPGYSVDEAYATNTELGRAGEDVFRKFTKGRLLHPEGKGEQSPLDVRVDGYGFEVKTVSTQSVAYKASPKAYEVDQKNKAARLLGLKPATALVVMDTPNNKGWLYWRPTFRGGRLSRRTGWLYMGSRALSEGIQEAGRDDDDHFYGAYSRGAGSRGGARSYKPGYKPRNPEARHLSWKDPTTWDPKDKRVQERLKMRRPKKEPQKTDWTEMTDEEIREKYLSRRKAYEDAGLRPDKNLRSKYHRARDALAHRNVDRAVWEIWNGQKVKGKWRDIHSEAEQSFYVSRPSHRGPRVHGEDVEYTVHWEQVLPAGNMGKWGSRDLTRTSSTPVLGLDLLKKDLRSALEQVERDVPEAMAAAFDMPEVSDVRGMLYEEAVRFDDDHFYGAWQRGRGFAPGSQNRRMKATPATVHPSIRKQWNTVEGERKAQLDKAAGFLNSQSRKFYDAGGSISASTLNDPALALDTQRRLTEMVSSLSVDVRREWRTREGTHFTFSSVDMPPEAGILFVAYNKNGAVAGTAFAREMFHEFTPNPSGRGGTKEWVSREGNAELMMIGSTGIMPGTGSALLSEIVKEYAPDGWEMSGEAIDAALPWWRRVTGGGGFSNEIDQGGYQFAGVSPVHMKYLASRLDVLADNE